MHDPPATEAEARRPRPDPDAPASCFRLSRQAFDEVGLRVRQNRLGFLGYLLTYQLIMSPIPVAGYAQELVGSARRW